MAKRKVYLDCSPCVSLQSPRQYQYILWSQSDHVLYMSSHTSLYKCLIIFNAHCNGLISIHQMQIPLHPLIKVTPKWKTMDRTNVYLILASSREHNLMMKTDLGFKGDFNHKNCIVTEHFCWDTKVIFLHETPTF